MFKNFNVPSRAELLAGISLASVMLGCSVQAYAQDVAAEQSSDAPASEDGIVVTGVRASLSSAQSIKRNSDVIVDSIVAEDIGKLPDRNVAEALQRITGIQVQRQYGEGSSVAIRGLTQSAPNSTAATSSPPRAPTSSTWRTSRPNCCRASTSTRTRRPT